MSLIFLPNDIINFSKFIYRIIRKKKSNESSNTISHLRNESDDGLILLERKFAYECLKKMRNEEKNEEEMTKNILKVLKTNHFYLVNKEFC